MQRPSEHTLNKYFENEASPKEAEKVMTWLTTKEGEKYLDEIYFNSKEDTIDQGYIFTNEAFKNVESKIAKQESQNDWRKKHNRRRKPMFAAAILAFMLVAIPLFYYLNEGEKVEEASITKKIEVRENPKGQKSTLSLPDGTKVKLNAESKIEFEEGLLGDKRCIKLYGEAFFDVAEDANRPFVVLVRDSLRVEALGTSFNIKAFKCEDQIEVALTTGKVLVDNKFERLSDGKKNLYLLPGKAYSFNKRTGKAIEKDFDIRTSLAWVDGLLLFKDARFWEIQNVLERWYGVEFDMKIPKRGIPPFTGEFKDESLKNVLENVSIACNFNYTINGKNVTVY